MSYEVLTDTHKVQVADHDNELKYVFNKEYDSSEGITIGTLYRIVHSTEPISMTGQEYRDVRIQDVPKRVFDFLDEEGYNVEKARSRFQF